MKCPVCGSEGNPEGSAFCGGCGGRLGLPQASAAAPPRRTAAAARLCISCGSERISLGGIPTWAVVAAVVGFCLVGVFSLLFLLVREPDRCLDCGAAQR